MSELIVRFGASPGPAFDVPVPLDIIDAAHRPRTPRPIMHLGKDLKITLVAGTYLVRAFLPSGEMLSEQVTLSPGNSPQLVELTPQTRSPSEDFAWSYYLQRPRFQQAPLDADMAREQKIMSASWGQLPAYDMWGHTPHEGWRRQFPPVLNRMANPRVEVDPRALGQISLDSLAMPPSAYWLEVSDPHYPMRFVALPWSPQLDVFFLLDAEPGQDADPLNVHVRPGSADALALLNHVQEGAFAEARDVAHAVNPEDLLFYKREVRSPAGPTQFFVETDPAGAAMAAYYALRADSPYGTMRNLFPLALLSAHPWMPDALVLHAWKLLSEDLPRAHEMARDQLLSAVRQGLPLFTLGLRFLLDGLNLFLQRRNGRDFEVAEALRVLEPYALAMDWQALTTTFYGQDPRQPQALTAT